jgi:hypothetical protein
MRPWAFSFDGYGGHGHIVVEVFDRDRRQWIMLDVYDNVMPVLAATGNPLAVRDFVPLFRGHEDAVKFIPIGAGRVAYSSAGKLREYYREGINEWYLWNGNNVVSRGRSSLLARLLGDAFEPLGELAAIALGEFPRIVPLPSPTSPAQVERMIALRARLLAIAGTCAVLVALLVVQLFALYRRRHRRHAPISDHP